MTDKEKRELIDRLRGKYPVGPLNENGEPEFGHRTFEEFTPPIQLEAADALKATLWRPIEEMPNNQNTVQLMSNKWLEPCSGCYISREYLAKEYDDPDYMEEGWYPSTGFLFDLPEVVIYPTHFKPLDTPETE
jgi:hypothetical protein